MRPLSTNSLHSAHTTLHSLPRFAVSSAAMSLLCPAFQALSAHYPCSCATLLRLQPLGLSSTPERSSSPIIGARLISCAYRSLTLESYSMVSVLLLTLKSGLSLQG